MAYVIINWFLASSYILFASLMYINPKYIIVPKSLKLLIVVKFRRS